MTVYTFTEIFTLAARLAEAVPLSPQIEVSFKLRKLGGRRLENFDPRRVPMMEWRRSADDLEEFGD